HPDQNQQPYGHPLLHAFVDKDFHTQRHFLQYGHPHRHIHVVGNTIQYFLTDRDTYQNQQPNGLEHIQFHPNEFFHGHFFHDRNPHRDENRNKYANPGRDFHRDQDSDFHRFFHPDPYSREYGDALGHPHGYINTYFEPDFHANPNRKCHRIYHPNFNIGQHGNSHEHRYF